jgi:hypothetical protein
MANCCGAARCTCRVIAGPGITVDGNGAPGAPYVISGQAAAGTVVQAADTSTLDAHVTGTGAAGDPYIVSGDVIVAPEPNGVEAAANGLLVAPSADAGNRLAFGGDGRLYVPPAPPPEVGCGLRGDGTAASPLAAYPIGGSDAWADHWNCTDTAHSTLKCDPATGALWTPPEHYTAADHLYQEHMSPSIASMGPTSGWAVLQPGGVPAFFRFDVPANFLGNDCRLWTWDSQVNGSMDINWSSTATFEVGYVVQKDGGPAMVRPLWSILTATGSARRERRAGGVCEAMFNLPAGSGSTVVYFPAVNVLTGTIGINSWTSDGTIHTTTQA